MPAISTDGSSVVYVLTEDVDLAEDIASQLPHFGYEVAVFADVCALQTECTEHTPDALIADIALPSGPLEGVGVAAELQPFMAEDAPVVLISRRDDWDARLAAVRAGGAAYFTKPVDISVLVEQLDRLKRPAEEEPIRVLVVEDEILVAQNYAKVLQLAGMETEIVTTPNQLLDALSAFRPDLILMDVYMPGCSGVEVAKVVRQYPSHGNTPIMYFSTGSVQPDQLVTLNVLGNDFLQEPISDDNLVAAVRVRARRHRGQHAMMSRDSLTGLLNHINLKLSLEHELAEVDRYSGRLSFAMLDLDHFKSVNDKYGHPVGDRVLKSLARLLMQRLRRADIAARYGGEEFALILPDTDPAAAQALVDEMRVAFSDVLHANGAGDFSVTFSAGIASAPPHDDMDALIRAADDALYEAKRSGRNRVVLDGRSQGG